MSRTRLILGLLFIAAILNSACGQKGDLYPPPDQPEKVKTKPKTN